MFGAASWDDGLDEAQLAAVAHGEGPLVIVAGAGTGKTRTLTARVAHLLERGVPPERVLLLSFTRRAADDMLARAASLSGHSELGRRLRGGTFHSVAHFMISAYAEVLGLPVGFSVLDPADAADVLDLLREGERAGTGEVRAPKSSTLVDVYSRCVNTRRSLSEVLANDFPWCEPHTDAIAGLFRSYVARKRTNGQLDFDDLLLYFRAALADEPIGERIVAMYDHVLVDEYQDVNALQVDIVRLLRPGGRGLTVVGDDAQAIYGFRGSDSRYLHDLATSMPEATVVALERNFRSLQPVLDLANVVRPSDPGLRLVLRGTRAGGRRPVLLRCHDAPSEARAVTDRILTLHEEGMRLRDQAVLVRAAHHSDLIELELTARRVPYRKFGGLRFVEAAHVKDFVATLRLLDNPADELAWFRLLRLHDGIGPSRARDLVQRLAPQEGWAGAEWSEAVAAAPPKARVVLGETLALVASARAAGSVSERVDAVCRALEPLVLSHYTAGEARNGDLARLASAAAEVGDLGTWLGEITLDPPASTGDFAGPPHLDEDYVVISTVHSAKGLEWLAVHLPHLVDGAFPSDMALTTPAGLAEERRLFYVAATRARDQLNLYTPLRMPHHRRSRNDRHSYAPASRFLDRDLLATVELAEQVPARLTAGLGAIGGLVENQAGEATVPVGAASVAADLDSLWR
ncbi:MAG: ATP-dependent helicase [Acidimicrobiales bacterium]|jgi:DNA helicase-2/ATP-dependent DNA helicase PcrA